MNDQIEVVPAVLRATLEGTTEDWNKVADAATHIQIDVTDGVFAGDGSFRDVARFKRLPHSEKIELHMMVHNPGHYVDQVIELNPARCVFHIEAFADGGHIDTTYKKLQAANTELGLALNPETPTSWVEEQLDLLDYVLFMGYAPGWAGQSINPVVFQKIGGFREAHPDVPVEVDGQVNKETIEPYVKAGARILCSNSGIFKEGDPVENLKQLQILAEASLSD